MFLKNLGKIFAMIGKGALSVALFVSQHPEVISIVAAAAKLPPNVAAGIAEGVQVAGAVASAETQK